MLNKFSDTLIYVLDGYTSFQVFPVIATPRSLSDVYMRVKVMRQTWVIEIGK